MLFILLFATLANTANVIYACSLKWAWFGSEVMGYFAGLKWIGSPSVSVFATLVTVTAATYVLLRYRSMTVYDQQFEKMLMRFSIISSVINIGLAIVLMLIK